MRYRAPAPPCAGIFCTACAVAKSRHLAMRQASEAVREGLAAYEADRRAGLPFPAWPKLPPGVLSDDETELWNYDPP